MFLCNLLNTYISHIKNSELSLTQKEVEWLIKEEFATSAEDILWRRTKLGLRLSNIQVKTLQEWMYNQRLVTL